MRYGECMEDIIVLRTKDACPQFHIIICTIFIFLSLFLAVLSTLLALFSLPFLHACRLLSLTPPHYFTILLSLSSILELGHRFRCREQTAQVSRSFSFLFPRIPTPYFTCMTSFFILCYRPSPSSCFARILIHFPLSYDLLSPASTSSCSRSSWLLRFPVCNCHII